MSNQDSMDPASVNRNQPSARKRLGLGGAALVVLVVAVLVALRQESPAAGPAAAPSASTAPETNAAAAVDPVTAPHGSNAMQTPAPASSWQRAGALRREATVTCKAAEWEKCGAALDEAARLDPDGERVPIVQRMHESVNRALHPDALSNAH